MNARANNAVRGSIGFALGMSIAASFASFGYDFAGLVLGGAVAGVVLSWSCRDFPIILFAAAGTVLGIFLGGLVVVISLVILFFDMPDASVQPNIMALLMFYPLFVGGFAVVGSSISAATAFRLLTLENSIKAFALSGTVGGAGILVSATLNVTTGILLSVILFLSLIAAGALCGAYMNSSEEPSLSIHGHHVGDEPLNT